MRASTWGHATKWLLRKSLAADPSESSAANPSKIDEGSIYLEAVVEHIDALIQLHVDAHALVQALHAVRRTPEEFRSVKHSAQQIDGSSLQKHLADKLGYFLARDRHLPCGQGARLNLLQS